MSGNFAPYCNALEWVTFTFQESEAATGYVALLNLHGCRRLCLMVTSVSFSPRFLEDLRRLGLSLAHHVRRQVSSYQ
jgi:hypothetical protein